MPEDLQDYLTRWFNQYGNHEMWADAEAWVNDMTNWELLQWISFYNEEHLTMK